LFKLTNFIGKWKYNTLEIFLETYCPLMSEIKHHA